MSVLFNLNVFGFKWTYPPASGAQNWHFFFFFPKHLGDRVLLGLSGGKDSLALLHVLHALQKKSPIKWELACVTVDPGTDAFDPSPLIPYLKSLDIPYFFLSERIIDRAKIQMQGNSICSFCARMKRGSLYTCARKNGYNVLALGQVSFATFIVSIHQRSMRQDNLTTLLLVEILVHFPVFFVFFSIWTILLKVFICPHFITVS